MGMLDDSFESLLWFLFAGTRGGPTRAVIVNSIRKRPMNKNQLATQLKLYYKTIEHHLKILADNKVLSIIKEGSYGAIYLLSDQMKASITSFDEIWKGFGKK